MKEIKSIEEIIYDYDNFIIDQWGVMHDGNYGYDHAISAVEKLFQENKKLIIITIQDNGIKIIDKIECL